VALARPRPILFSPNLNALVFSFPIRRIACPKYLNKTFSQYNLPSCPPPEEVWPHILAVAGLRPSPHPSFFLIPPVITSCIGFQLATLLPHPAQLPNRQKKVCSARFVSRFRSCSSFMRPHSRSVDFNLGYRTLVSASPDSPPPPF